MEKMAKRGCKRGSERVLLGQNKRERKKGDEAMTLYNLKAIAYTGQIGYLSPGTKEFDFASAGFESFIDLNDTMHSYNDQVAIHKALGDETGLDEIQLIQLDITKDGERTEKVIKNERF